MDVLPLLGGPIAGAVMVAVCAAWLLTSAVATLLTFIFALRARRPRRRAKQAACVVLSPIRGGGPGVQGFVARLLDQDHTNYRVIFIVENAADPAFPIVALAASKSGGRVSVLLAGPALDCGQKVENLKVGLRHLEPQDEVIVFVDADGDLQRDWLSQLTRPLSFGRDLTGGFQVLVPRIWNLANIAASLISLGIATSFAPPGFGLCWGGSTAIKRAALVTLDPEKYLAGTVSDDLSLSRAARDRSIALHMNLNVRVAVPIAYDWPAFLDYARRQYRLVRIYAFEHWRVVLWTLLVTPAGLIATAVLLLWGHLSALAVPLGVLVLQQARFVLRKQALGRLLDVASMQELAPVFRLQHLLGGPACFVHLYCVLGSAFGGTIRWAGRTYLVAGPEKMRIIEPVAIVKQGEA